MRNCIPAPAVGRRLSPQSSVLSPEASPSGGMADAVDSKSTALWGMPVRVRPRAPNLLTVHRWPLAEVTQSTENGQRSTANDKARAPILLAVHRWPLAEVIRSTANGQQPTTKACADS